MMSWSDDWVWIGAIQIALFWAGVTALVVWLVRRVAPHRPDASSSATERYARGEISDEEFEKIHSNQSEPPGAG